jgi:hypothetical protein
VSLRAYTARWVCALNINTSRFARRGDTYESDDFVSTPNRVDLLVRGGVGEVSVN